MFRNFLIIDDETKHCFSHKIVCNAVMRYAFGVLTSCLCLLNNNITHGRNEQLSAVDCCLRSFVYDINISL